MEEAQQYNQNASALEALLFIYGEPLELKKVAQTLGLKVEEVAQAAESLRQSLKARQSGLQLMQNGTQVQLTTSSAFAGLLEKVVKSELSENLTPAGLETLAIISYAAPISRAEIDYIRGVNSSFILRNLLLRGLIERSTDPQRGNAYVYGPSFDFLRYVGVSRAEELPDYQKFRDLAKNVRSAQVTQTANSTAPVQPPTPQPADAFTGVQMTVSKSSIETPAVEKPQEVPAQATIKEEPDPIAPTPSPDSDEAELLDEPYEQDGIN
jgi:segregation and condensation protein B